MKSSLAFTLLLLSTPSIASPLCANLLKNPPLTITSHYLRQIYHENFSGHQTPKHRGLYHNHPEINQYASNVFFSLMMEFGLGEYNPFSRSIEVKPPEDSFSSYSRFISIFDNLSLNELNYYVEKAQPQTFVYTMFKTTVENIINSNTLIPKQKRVLLERALNVLRRNKFDSEEAMINLELLFLIESFNS